MRCVVIMSTTYREGSIPLASYRLVSADINTTTTQSLSLFIHLTGDMTRELLSEL